MGKGNVAARLHANMCEDSGFGYSQDNRWGGGPMRTWAVDGRNYQISSGDYDCSSSVITAWRKALEGTKYEGALYDASYTGNIEEVFVGSGLFEVRPMSFLAEPGDLYLKPGSHVAMCQTQVPDILSEFSINEYGTISGGQPGDQTGREAWVHGYYSFADRIIHYTGKADDAPKPQPKPEPPRGYSAKLYHTNGTNAQRFKIEEADNGWVRIKSVERGMCLDVRDGAKADHTPVRVWKGNGSDAQLWKLIEVKKPYALLYELEPKCAKGMRLDAINGGTADKTGLQIHPDNNTPAQRWQFIYCGDGTYIIVSSKSGLAIDCGAGVQP